MFDNRVFTINVKGYRDLRGRFARAGRETIEAQKDEVRNLLRRIVWLLRDEAPHRTGNLKKKLGFKTRDRMGSTEGRITSGAKYTQWVIHGRGPVVAKKAKALRFEPGPPGSGFIFRKRVGPARANPFHKRAMRRASGEGEPMQSAVKIGRRVERAYSRL